MIKIQTIVITLVVFLSFNIYADIKISPDRNPKYNSNINPKYNSNINPKYNSNINPKYNRSINGVYIFATNNDVTGFMVFYDEIGISFDLNNNLNGYLIPHDKGFNSYDKSMTMRELWLNNSSSGYNIFDLSNNWIGHAN